MSRGGVTILVLAIVLAVSNVWATQDSEVHSLEENMNSEPEGQAGGNMVDKSSEAASLSAKAVVALKKAHSADLSAAKLVEEDLRAKNILKDAAGYEALARQHLQSGIASIQDAKAKLAKLINAKKADKKAWQAAHKQEKASVIVAAKAMKLQAETKELQAQRHELAKSLSTKVKHLMRRVATAQQAYSIASQRAAEAAKAATKAADMAHDATIAAADDKQSAVDGFQNKASHRAALANIAAEAASKATQDAAHIARYAQKLAGQLAQAKTKTGTTASKAAATDKVMKVSDDKAKAAIANAVKAKKAFQAISQKLHGEESLNQDEIDLLGKLGFSTQASKRVEQHAQMILAADSQKFSVLSLRSKKAIELASAAKAQARALTKAASEVSQQASQMAQAAALKTQQNVDPNDWDDLLRHSPPSKTPAVKMDQISALAAAKLTQTSATTTTKEVTSTENASAEEAAKLAESGQKKQRRSLAESADTKLNKEISASTAAQLAMQEAAKAQKKQQNHLGDSPDNKPNKENSASTAAQLAMQAADLAESKQKKQRRSLAESADSELSRVNSASKAAQLAMLGAIRAAHKATVLKEVTGVQDSAAEAAKRAELTLEPLKHLSQLADSNDFQLSQETSASSAAKGVLGFSNMHSVQVSPTTAESTSAAAAAQLATRAVLPFTKTDNSATKAAMFTESALEDRD